MSKHVAVLMGGWSGEREVSLSSGHECAKALREAGYRVTEVDVDRNIPFRLAELKPDVCFNALHGRIGEDGNIQGLLNILDIPYTHSGVEASAIAMDKPRAKELFMRAGLKCPPGVVRSRAEALESESLKRPYVLKPIDQGSSLGVHIVRPGDNYSPTEEDWPFGDVVLEEKFIPGRELTVAVLDGAALAVTEITSEHGFYDYDAKYADGGSIHILPAKLPEAVTSRALEMAEQAHATLGCRGVSRADLRFNDSEGDASPDNLYLLEVNTQPGMTPTSLVPEQAGFHGMNFPALCAKLVEDARCDY
ncbi:D-alanine--D-alanine ligase [uncultured Nisaea sp.]|jgi:D-alanine-D-alanine ligase|uniref:D-alanine--D-alanine ligase n=1 Tax=uncultured Nisaea sp. TaxID=538215 RepID=UPI0030ED4B01|tara:strand:+ start:2164 stop:3081 length:918 start_codon:yes stop_codon:yes gene_type:complete